MKIYESELKALEFCKLNESAPALSTDQLQAINVYSQVLVKQAYKHKALHNLLTLLIIASLLIIDLYVFTLQGMLGLVLMTLVHGFITYSLTIYTMHEGMGHQRLILGNNLGLRLLANICNNVSRLFFADPLFYKKVHPTHHQSLGTKDDKAFTNAVEPKRIWKSFLPLAAVLPFCDYKIHSSDAWDKSKALSLVISLLFGGIQLFLAIEHHSILSMVLILLVFSPWVAFCLDRLRESGEHLVMLDGSLPATRDIGLNFWGLLIGGGFWGQPCHLSHHIAPALPWYQQIRLSIYLQKILTPLQLDYYFFPQSILGYPKKLFQLLLKNKQLFTQSSKL